MKKKEQIYVDRGRIKIESYTTPVDYTVETTGWQRLILWLGFPISFPIGVIIGLMYGFSLSEVKDELLEVYLGIN